MRTQGRVPSIGAIKQMTGEAVYMALTNGVMKTQGGGLSTQQLFALIFYVAADRRGQLEDLV